MEKFAENCKNFSKIWDIKTYFGQNKSPIMWKFILSESERHFNKLSCFSFHEKILSGS